MQRGEIVALVPLLVPASARKIPAERTAVAVQTHMAIVVIPALWRTLTQGKDRIQASGATLKDIIDDLERQFPGFRERVVEQGDLAGSIAVSIDGEIVTGGLSEPVPPHSEVHFVPAIGGG